MINWSEAVKNGANQRARIIREELRKNAGFLKL